MYSLGRHSGFADREEIERIVERAGLQDYGLRTIVQEIVLSKIFRSP
jgi:hypothetical protein